jgi:hypothetical protein
MRYLLLFFLLGIVIITGGCVGPGPWSDPCGNGWVDVRYQHCCGNTAYSNEEMRGYVCCGDKRYEQSRSSEIHYACCNYSTIYDTNSQVCCGNGLYDSNTHDCCGGTVFNINTQGCCNYDTVYDKTTQHCCNKTVGPGAGTNWYTCGGVCINYYTDSCCNEIPFNLNTQSCCSGIDGKIHEGKDSCCIDRPSSVNGKFCQPNSGNYQSPDSGGGCTSGYGPLSCAQQKFWNDRPDLKH